MGGLLILNRLVEVFAQLSGFCSDDTHAISSAGTERRECLVSYCVLRMFYSERIP